MLTLHSGAGTVGQTAAGDRETSRRGLLRDATQCCADPRIPAYYEAATSDPAELRDRPQRPRNKHSQYGTPRPGKAPYSVCAALSSFLLAELVKMKAEVSIQFPCVNKLMMSLSYSELTGKTSINLKLIG